MKNLRNKIHYDELYQLYIVENKTRKELAKYFNVSESLLKERISELNIRKPVSLRVKNTEKICLERYGVTNAGGIPETLEKIKNILKEKYGNACYFKTDDYKIKFDKYLKENNITNVFQREDVKEKIKQTNLKRYGAEHNMQNSDIVNKSFKTKKSKNSFKKSKEEDRVYQLLKEKFNTVERQYKSRLYPFHCDFYIQKLNLYIEYQGFWTHGWDLNKLYGPFDKSNENHQKLLLKWQQRANTGHKAYNNAIKVWTISDPLKRKIAKENNLNWIKFFSIEQFMEWYNQQ